MESKDSQLSITEDDNGKRHITSSIDSDQGPYVFGIVIHTIDLPPNWNDEKYAEYLPKCVWFDSSAVLPDDQLQSTYKFLVVTAPSGEQADVAIGRITQAVWFIGVVWPQALNLTLVNKSDVHKRKLDTPQCKSKMSKVILQRSKNLRQSWLLTQVTEARALMQRKVDITIFSFCATWAVGALAMMFGERA